MAISTTKKAPSGARRRQARGREAPPKRASILINPGFIEVLKKDGGAPERAGKSPLVQNRYYNVCTAFSVAQDLAIVELPKPIPSNLNLNFDNNSTVTE